MRGLLFLIAASALLGQRLEQRTVTVRGVERTYWVATPVDRGPAPATLVVFHAAGGTGDAVARRSRLHLAGVGRKWFVIYPNGLNKTWNAQDGADVEFTKAVLDAVQQSDKRIDRSKTYAAGAGSGGALVEKLACEASDRFAAIAVISTTGVPQALRTACKPEMATPLLLLNGPKTSALAAAETFDFWRKTFGCTEATVTTAKPCRDGAEVRQVSGAAAGEGPWVEEAAQEINQFFFRFRRLPKF